MKSRWIFPLLLWALVPALQVAAQVVPLSRLNPLQSSVQPAGCQSCGISGGVPVSDPGTVWGTSCMECNYRPALFAPCPNPCDRTLLGELLYGVRDAVDCGLSRISCCLLGGCGMPCGCETGGCEAACGVETYPSGCGCDAGATSTYTVPSPMMGSPTPAMPHPTPAPAEPQANPFQDDPVQGSGVQPIKKASQPSTGVRRSTTARRNRVQRTSFEETTEPVLSAEYEEESPVVEPARLNVGSQSGRHSYQLRRTTNLRTSSGTQLQMAPIQHSDSPAMRFR